jgi:hypothetical protein
MNFQITEKDKIIIINFNDFIKEYNPIIPMYQREFIEERVLYFYNKLIKYALSDKYSIKYPIPFLNMIYCSIFDKNVYILDGQHRFYAYKKYYTETKRDFNIVVNIKECDTSNEVKEYFQELNNNYVLHKLILEENDLEKAKEIKIYMKIKYGKHLSNSESPRYPNINLDQFCNYLLNNYKDITSKSMLQKMEELNEDIKKNLKNENYELYELAHKKQDFYLGYIFIKNENEQKRKKIPTTVRHKLWRNSFVNSTNGLCYVCKNDITIDNFHAGHIISVRNGGNDNIDNLKIVCPLCNLSMGIQNLEEFKKKYF